MPSAWQLKHYIKISNYIVNHNTFGSLQNIYSLKNEAEWTRLLLQHDWIPALRFQQGFSSSSNSLCKIAFNVHMLSSSHILLAYNSASPRTDRKQPPARAISHYLRQWHDARETMPFRSPRQRVTVRDRCSGAAFLNDTQAATVLWPAHAVRAWGPFTSMDLERGFPISSRYRKSSSHQQSYTRGRLGLRFTLFENTGAKRLRKWTCVTQIASKNSNHFLHVPCVPA